MKRRRLPFAGANSIFYGDKLIASIRPRTRTRIFFAPWTPNPDPSVPQPVKIAIGSDHAGYSYKQQIIEHLKGKGQGSSI